MKATILMLAAAAALSSAAHAQPHQAEIIVTPAQLTSPEGRAALRERIVEAAEEVCPISDARVLALRAEQRACMDAAITDAEAQLREKVAQVSVNRFAGADRASRSTEG